MLNKRTGVLYCTAVKHENCSTGGETIKFSTDILRNAEISNSLLGTGTSVSEQFRGGDGMHVSINTIESLIQEITLQETQDTQFLRIE